jgi:hypothetical protein
MQIDRVVLINLKRRPDRLEGFLEHFPEPWPFPVPQVFEAVDGWGQFLPPPWRGSGAGAHGCWLSHLTVLRQAMEDQVEELLVLEDDARFVPHFAKRFREFERELPLDWRLVMLGGQHDGMPTPVAPLVLRCSDTRRTHAYVVRRSGMPALLGTWLTATTHIDFLLPRVQERIRTYAPRPFLVGQGRGVSDVTGHLESELWY